MRFRKDVKDGMIVYKNRGGWIVPLSRPIGKAIAVYVDSQNFLKGKDDRNKYSIALGNDNDPLNKVCGMISL